MRRSHVLVTLTTVIVLCLALPAAGATSPLKLAKSALGLSKKASKTATSAKRTALAANVKAQSALDALKKPVANAVSAQTAVTAGSATNATNAANAGTAQTAGRATTAGSADNVIVLPTRKVSVTGAAATQAAARAAASEVTLLARGPLTVYGKCYRDTGAGRVYGEVFVKSSVDGSTLASDGSDLNDGTTADYLSVATPEANATVDTESVLNNAADTGYSDDGQFQVMAPDGSFIDGYVTLGEKQGTLPGGNGPYPATDGCMFNGVLNVG